MDLSPRILGTSTANDLRTRATASILNIGKDGFSRTSLASVECFNYIAAANLERALQALDVKDTKDLFDRVPPSALAVPRVGAIALAVLGAAFEAKGLGGNSPLEAWVARHAPHSNGKATANDVAHAMVTFGTMKAREAADAANRKVKNRRARRRQQ